MKRMVKALKGGKQMEALIRLRDPPDVVVEWL